MASSSLPAELKPITLPAANQNIIRLAPWHMYRTDVVLRRAECLQKTIDPAHFAARMNKQTAEKLGLTQTGSVKATQNNVTITLPLVIDERIADDAVMIASGTLQAKGFGQTMAPVTLARGEAQ